MSVQIRSCEFYYCLVPDMPGEAYKVLSSLSDLGVNLLAFQIIPMGPDMTQLALFPQDKHRLERIAKNAKLKLEGPHPAILVQGKDKVGALSDVHYKLYSVGVNVYAAYGVTDGHDEFGYVIYVRPEQFQRAIETLLEK